MTIVGCTRRVVVVIREQRSNAGIKSFFERQTQFGNLVGSGDFDGLFWRNRCALAAFVEQIDADDVSR